MRNLIIVVFLIFVLFNLSCEHDKCCAPPLPASHIMASKNGVSWSSFWVNGTVSALDSLKIYARTTTDATYPTSKVDSMSFKILYTDIGNYSLHSNQVFYATFTNGVTKSYKLDTTYNNVLSITGYDRLHNQATTNPDPIKVSGTFNLKFIDPDNPAGISFTGGNFYTLISQ